MGYGPFMRLHYLNLDRSLQRRVLMERQGTALGVELERVVAIDGQHLPEPEIKSAIEGSIRYRPLGRGEVACALGHKLTWQRIANDDAEFGFVFEDDVVFSMDARNFLIGDNWIPPNIDLVKLDTYFQTFSGQRPSITHQISDQFHLHPLPVSAASASAYVLSRNFARRLLQSPHVGLVPADDALFCPMSRLAPSRRVFQLSPAICVQTLFVDGHHEEVASVIDGIDNRNEVKVGQSRIKKMCRKVWRSPKKLSMLLERKHGGTWIVPFSQPTLVVPPVPSSMCVP